MFYYFAIAQSESPLGIGNRVWERHPKQADLSRALRADYYY